MQRNVNNYFFIALKFNTLELNMYNDLRSFLFELKTIIFFGINTIFDI